MRKSTRILMVCGPALGHVGRAMTIAAKMRERGAMVEFAIPSNTSFADVPAQEGFRVYLVPSSTDNEANRTVFTGALETHVANAAVDIIVLDIAAVRWLSVVQWPAGVPRAYVTNFFLSAAFGERSLQDQQFEKEGEGINRDRAVRGMAPLGSPRELYAGDIVLFADPPELVEIAGLAKSTAVVVGPCAWDAPGEMPAEIGGLSDLLVVSPGSTGELGMAPRLLAHLKAVSEASASVFVGPQDIGSAPLHDFTFRMVPLAPLFRKACLAVTRGGSGTSYLALMNGVPMAIVGGHSNQKTLAVLLARLGVSVEIDQAGGLRALTRESVRDMRERAAPIAANPFNQSGPQRAAEAILSLV